MEKIVKLEAGLQISVSKKPVSTEKTEFLYWLQNAEH